MIKLKRTIITLIISISSVGFIGCSKFQNNEVSEDMVIDTFIGTPFFAAAINEEGKLLTTAKFKDKVEKWSNLVSISGSGAHIVGLKSDGTVLAEGTQGFNRDEIKKWKDIIQINANQNYTVGLRKDGTIIYSGDNAFNYNDRVVDVSDFINIKKIYSSNQILAGLREDGTVKLIEVATNLTFGKLKKEELKEVESWTDITDISLGYGFIIGLKTDGTVVGVGNNKYGQLDIDQWNGIQKVITSGESTIGLKTDGTVVATGRNDSGKCDVEHLTNIENIFSTPNSSNTFIDKDGNIDTVGLNSEMALFKKYRLYEGEKENWSNIKDIVYGQDFVVGLRENGEATLIYIDDSSEKEGIEEVNDWVNIRID